jgi:hypothetical protein
MIEGRYQKEFEVFTYSRDKFMYFYRILILVGDYYGGVDL